MKSFTRRETIALIICGIVFVVCLFVPQELLNTFERPILVLLVAPLAFYIATDPERMDNKNS